MNITTDPHRWSLFTRASDIWAAIADDCSRARRRIDIEQYILADDPVGRGICSLLADKARDGVRVRLLVDYFGSRDILNSDARKELQAAGAEIAAYNPIWRLPLYGLRRHIRRDHRKMVLADEVAHVGSACFEARMADWREMTVRLEGPVVSDIANAFDATWRIAARERPRHRRGGGPAEARDPDFEYIGNGTTKARKLYRRILHQVSQARRHVMLCSPYLLPDRRFMAALASARRHGAAVTAIVPQQIDPVLVDAVAWSRYDRLLRAGCRIVSYAPVPLHTKAIVVDGSWATLGSMNLDRLSFHLNLEGNVCSSDESFVSAVEAELQALVRSSEDIDLETWKNRPWRKKLLGAIGRPLTRFL